VLCVPLQSIDIQREPLSLKRVARRLLPRRHPIPVPFPKASSSLFTLRRRSVHPFLSSSCRGRGRRALPRLKQSTSREKEAPTSVHARCVHRVACRSHLHLARDSTDGAERSAQRALSPYVRGLVVLPDLSIERSSWPSCDIS